MVARRDGLKTLADFKGQEVVMPFRGDMPDALFRLLCRKQGIDPDKDMTLRYVASPLDAMQLLITRRADNALLADPAVAVGLRKSQSFPISVVAPSLYRSVSLQEEWGRVFNRAPRMPQAGIVMLGSQLGNTALAKRFEEACEEAQQWCEANPDECGQIVARRIEMLTPEGVAGCHPCRQIRHGGGQQGTARAGVLLPAAAGNAARSGGRQAARRRVLLCGLIVCPEMKKPGKIPGSRCPEPCVPGHVPASVDSGHHSVPVSVT